MVKVKLRFSWINQPLKPEFGLHRTWARNRVLIEIFQPCDTYKQAHIRQNTDLVLHFTPLISLRHRHQHGHSGAVIFQGALELSAAVHGTCTHLHAVLCTLNTVKDVVVVVVSIAVVSKYDFDFLPLRNQRTQQPRGLWHSCRLCRRFEPRCTLAIREAGLPLPVSLWLLLRLILSCAPTTVLSKTQLTITSLSGWMRT